MKLIYLDSVDSTHTYLKDYIKNNGYEEFTAVITNNQTNGIGSRDNRWVGERGNLFFSFVMDKKSLPEDLPLNSMSIYFSYILKSILENKGSNVWIKWPNDFYIQKEKIGGTITTLKNDLVYCGIGLNLKERRDDFGCLDIVLEQEKSLDEYFLQITEGKKWKQIFSKYLIEFNKSRTMTATIGNRKVSLENVELNDDGSISIEGKKVFSLR